MNPLALGLVLVVGAAAFNAAFAVPFRFRRHYEWENTWLLAMLFAMILLPLFTATFLLPQWPSAIAASGIPIVAKAAFFGFLWGMGCVTFAIGIDSIGISLGYAIIMGVVTAVGSTIPMLRKWSQIPSDARVVILFGVGVCIAGVAICGKAGMERERGMNSKSPSVAGLSSAEEIAAKNLILGLTWCVLSGVLSAGNNLGFDFADRIAEQAQRLGAQPAFASLGRWIAVYWGGYLAVLIFCGAKMLRTGGWKKFVGPDSGHDAGLAALMGLLLFLSQMIYGIGAFYVGRLGTTVGFAVMVAGSLILANIFGFMLGEWKAASRPSLKVLFVGLATLIFAVIVLSYGNSLLGPA
jgi:L-rhamnose-H+ transport protein